ncbi:MAG: hypothetical protein ACMG6S_15505 [Byssovorax sp.]
MAGALAAWISAFAFTQAVEIPLYVAVVRRSVRAGATSRPVSLAAQIALAFGASAVTHPIVWFLIPRIPYGPYAEMVARAELFAVIVEAFYFYVLEVFDLRRALLWSLAINATSASLGLLSRWAFGWP